ncbi:caspase-2-like isoform X2 [Penaeus indicus]
MATQKLLEETERNETLITAYAITSDEPGHVYVFNYDFKGDKMERLGANEDSNNLLETFTRMGYEVSLLENLSAQKTMAEVDRIRSDPALANVDVLVMVFLSHDIGSFKFMAGDMTKLDLRQIRRKFTDSLCPNLEGKPKIFFANFCRKNGLHIQTDGVKPTRDMVTIHAAQDGLSAVRNPCNGNLFVWALCSVLEKHAADKNLRDIYFELEKKMTKSKRTVPHWEDDVFRDFYFTQKAFNKARARIPSNINNGNCYLICTLHTTTNSHYYYYII